MDFTYLFLKFPMIRTVENWYGQNRTGRTARSGLDKVQSNTDLL